MIKPLVLDYCVNDSFDSFIRINQALNVSLSIILLNGPTTSGPNPAQTAKSFKAQTRPEKARK